MFPLRRDLAAFPSSCGLYLIVFVNYMRELDRALSPASTVVNSLPFFGTSE